jgi:hypothetical protein
MLRAQTKGTNTLGLGVGIQKYKYSQNIAGTSTVSDQQITRFSMSYGQFIRQNEKAGIDLFYGSSGFNSTSDNAFNSNSYGGKITYQRYFNLVKSFYAFGGGRGGYDYYESNAQGNVSGSDFSTSSSSLGAYGGVSWFLSKRFALEADLLSADIGYSKMTNKSTGGTGPYNTSTDNFNLSSAGAINNIGFKIHFLF